MFIKRREKPISPERGSPGEFLSSIGAASASAFAFGRGFIKGGDRKPLIILLAAALIASSLLVGARAFASPVSGNESGGDGSGGEQSLVENQYENLDNGRISYDGDIEGNRLVNPDGTNDEPAPFDGNDAVVSPDGNKVAYRDFSNIYVANANGTGEIQITEEDPGPNEEIYVTNPAWSPDGDQLVYERSDCDYNPDTFEFENCLYQIFKENVDGQSTATAIATSGDQSFDSPDWSPDGEKIAYSTYDDNDGYYDIFVMDASDGGNKTNLTNTPDRDEYNPDWHPGGHKIAYADSFRDSVRFKSQIFVMNADGSGRANISNIGSALVNHGEPSYSPDGQQITFRSDDLIEDSSFGETYYYPIASTIHKMNADGSGQTFLAGSDYSESPDWTVIPLADDTGGGGDFGISFTDPDTDETGFSTGRSIFMSFTSDLDESSVTNDTFTLVNDDTGESVAGTFEVSSDNPRHLNFLPDDLLEENTNYTATIKSGTDGVKSADGGTLAEDYSWSFTTGEGNGGGGVDGTDLSVKLDASPKRTESDRPITFFNEIVNYGETSATNSMFTLDLPQDESGNLLVEDIEVDAYYYDENDEKASLSDACSVADGKVTCELGEINYFEYIHVDVSVMPTSEGSLSATANVSSDEEDSDDTNDSDTATVEVGPGQAQPIADAIERETPNITSARYADSPNLANPNAASEKPLAGFPTNGPSYGIMTTENAATAQYDNNGDEEEPIEEFSINAAPDSPAAEEAVEEREEEAEETEENTNSPVGPASEGFSAQGLSGIEDEEPGDPEPGNPETGSPGNRGDTAEDVSVIEFDLDVPQGDSCLVMDFRFLSDEFPEYVGTSFNDAFIAELDESTWTTSGSDIIAPRNFAFDPSNEVVSINSTGVANMSTAQAEGANFSGATRKLTAKTEISAGQHKLYLSIFDQGDEVLDSAVFVDNLDFTAESGENCESGIQTPPPTANNDSYSVGEDGTLTADGVDTNPEGILENDDDISGNEVTVVDSDENVEGIQPASSPENGTLELAEDGTFTYTPDENFHGEDTFTYRSDNGIRRSEPATVAITVNPDNDAPAATDGAATTNEDTPVNISLGDFVSDAETADMNLAYEIVSGPAANTGTLSGSGATKTFAPAANFNGEATFTYRVTDRGDPEDCGAADNDCDAAEMSETKTITVTVSPVNDAPTITAIADQEIGQDTDTADIAFTVADPDDAPATLTLSGSSDNPSLVPNANITFGGSGGDRTVKVTPEPAETGVSNITVTVSDGEANASRTFELTVNDTQAPVVTIADKPAATTSSGDATFTFSSDENGAAFQCKLDGENFSNCASPVNYEDLTLGSHAFTVKTADAAGNEGSAEYTWEIEEDTVPSTNTPAGGTTSSGENVNENDPASTGVTTPQGGNVSITESPVVTTNPVVGLTLLGQEIEISAPQATDTAPLSLTFRFHTSLIPEGEDESSLVMLRNGQRIRNCTALNPMRPLPACVSNRTLSGQTITLTVLATAASTWNVAVDDTAPAAPVISGPANNATLTSSTVTFSGTAEAGSVVKLSENGASKGQATANDGNGAWSISVPNVSNGPHTFNATATDEAGNVSDASSRTFTVNAPPADTTAPTVSSFGPTGSSEAATANAFVVFSESVAGVGSANFKLAKGGVNVPATVSYNDSAKRATLDPSASLTPGATYTATLADTQIEDLAGNSLAQGKTWTFKVKPPTVKPKPKPKPKPKKPKKKKKKKKR